MKLTLFISISLSGLLHAQLDTDNNNLDDVWELFYGTSGLTANRDADGDGMSNAQEAIAGTDPLNPDSVLKMDLLTPGAASLELRWSALTNKSYQIFSSSSLDGFSPMGAVHLGGNTMMSESVAIRGVEKMFFRVAVEDLDSDSDQIFDWAETAVGLNPFDASSTPGSNDFAILSNAMQQTPNVSLKVLEYVAIEGEQSARVQLSRSGSPKPLTVSLALTHGTSSASDFSAIPSSVTFLPHERSKVVMIPAIDDSTAEAEETFTVSIPSSSDYTLGNASGDLSIIDGTRPVLSSGQIASRFLHQVTYGPREAEITALAPEIDSLGEAAALSAWIDAQIALPVTQMRRTDPEYNYSFVIDWLELAFEAPDQLRQRIAYALSQIFVVSQRNPDLAQADGGVAHYYDILLNHSFGNYRDLLQEIAVSPIMAIYLSHLGNEKADPEKGTAPDENFAREIMQLFSIGLVQLNQDGTPKLDLNGQAIPTYSNDEITELARVFTGLSYDEIRFRNSGLPVNRDLLLVPLKMWEESHDTGAKQLITYPGVSNGGRLPDFSEENERGGMDDIQDAVDILFHHPNVGPSIALRLIQRIVKSHPSPQYLSDVAAVFNDNGSGVRGDLGAVVKAIILHPEARDSVRIRQSTHGRLREPLLQEVNLMRTFSIPRNGNKYTYTGGFWFNGNTYYQYDAIYRMQPMFSSTVFNFYTPEYIPVGGLKDRGLLGPEFQIIDDISIVIGGAHLRVATQRGPARNAPPWHSEQLDVSRQVGILSDDGAEALVDHLELLFAPGQLSAETRALILTALSETAGRDAEDRTRMALFLVISSPDGSIAR